MLKVRYKQNIILVITFISVMLLCTSSVLALEPHENPETATQVFNGISLLRHYSNSLDSVLQKDITGIETKLVKMPFSNIPDTLDESSEEFTVSSINICHLVVEIDESVMNFQSLLGEFRLDEATEFATDIISTLKEANDEL